MRSTNEYGSLCNLLRVEYDGIRGHESGWSGHGNLDMAWWLLSRTLVFCIRSLVASAGSHHMSSQREMEHDKPGK